MQAQDLKRIIKFGVPSTEADARTILGATPSADFKSIRKLYRKLAGEAHPDKFANDSSLTAKATQAMQIVNAAWEIIDGLHAIGQLGASSTQEAPRAARTQSSSWGPGVRLPRNDECDLCGSWPARRMSIRSLTTVLIWFSPGNYTGTVCRSCGTALFRNALRRTMLGGWWGIATIVTPIYFLMYLNVYSKLKAMRPPSYRDINVAVPFRSPALPPRNPFKSVGPLLVTGVVLVFWGWALFGVVTSPSSSSSSGGIVVGTCFVDTGNTSVGQVPCTDVHDYVVVQMTTDIGACAQDFVPADSGFACLRKVR